jgi:muramoyltetrapeptide carboxypeptidase
LKAAGHILFLEDVGEQLYHIDRMMVQLKRAGALDGVKGIVLGYFTDLKDTTPSFGTTVEEIVRSHAPITVPIIAGYPAGHARPNLPIPFGVEARLQVKDGSCSLDAGLAVS